jgi:tripartite-type tricarboxylate transporter receptor subunit TctC
MRIHGWGWPHPLTPKEVTRTISNAIGRAFTQPELRARIIALEANPLGSTPDEMRELIRQSLAHWEPVVEAAKIAVE